MDAVDAVVIGAGVVGLAIGRALAQRGLETILLEAAGAIGTATSSRNSEVIHAGVYYATGSLKARLCVAGRERLVDHCVAHGVAHRRCGELIVATDAAQRPQLERLREQATCNGVHDLCWLEADELRAIEPQLRAVAARHFSLIGRAPFSHLVYPVPEAAGLGVHLTLDLGGQARFGPDVEWIELSSPDEVFYGVDPFRAAGFEAAIRRYWRGLPDLALQPAYSGVRSKLALAGTVLQDFMLHGPAEHGVAGLMNLFGIESPGLTASLALADEVVSRLGL